MATVAVIGSNSFSGSDFIDLLLSTTKHDVLGISRSPEKSELFLPYLSNSESGRFRFRQLDLDSDMAAIQDVLEEAQPAQVVNFASQSEVAPSWDHPEQWFQTNAVAIAALGNFLKGKAWLQRYLHVSTPEIYGHCRGDVSEDAPFNPSTPYAASRAAGEWILRLLHRQYGLPVLFVRSANVFGAHQQLHKIVPRAAIYLKLGRPIELHGGGYARRSFIHIRDVSRGELAILEYGRPGEAYHLATRETVRIRDLVRRVGELRGADLETSTRTTGERPGHDDAYLLDISKAARELSWEPQISLDDGLREVVEWVDREWQRIQSEPLEYAHAAPAPQGARRARVGDDRSVG